jgi:hypothetical protein
VNNQSTVSENVVDSCSVPDVAVTVTVDVTGCVPPPPPPPPELPPPHPFASPTPARPTASTTSIGQLLRLFHPTQQKATATAVSGQNGIPPRRCNSATVAAVVTVSVVDVVPGGVTVAGEKVHEISTVDPVQANEIAELNPFTGVTVTVVFALPPAFAVKIAGEVMIEKLGVIV